MWTTRTQMKFWLCNWWPVNWCSSSTTGMKNWQSASTVPQCYAVAVGTGWWPRGEAGFWVEHGCKHTQADLRVSVRVSCGMEIGNSDRNPKIGSHVVQNYRSLFRSEFGPWGTFFRHLLVLLTQHISITHKCTISSLGSQLKSCCCYRYGIDGVLSVMKMDDRGHAVSYVESTRGNTLTYGMTLPSKITLGGSPESVSAFLLRK